jgi:hypothetical protein
VNFSRQQCAAGSLRACERCRISRPEHAGFEWQARSRKRGPDRRLPSGASDRGRGSLCKERGNLSTTATYAGSLTLMGAMACRAVCGARAPILSARRARGLPIGSVVP